MYIKGKIKTMFVFRRCVIENRTYNCLRGTNKCDIREGFII